MIKKLIMLLLSCLIIAGCSKQETAADNDYKLESKGTVAAKMAGGNAAITLPANQKLQLVTWKDKNSLWLLYRPMRPEEKAETYTYREDSMFGIMEAIITIKEIKK